MDSQQTSGVLGDQTTALSRALWVGRILLVIAAVLWSTNGFFAKAPTFDSWPQELRGSLLVFWRAVFASLVLIFLVRKVAWSWKLLVATLFFAAMNWAYLNALVYSEATLAIWLQYSAPVWVFAGGVAFFREKPINQDWWLLGFVVLGVAVILSAELNGASWVGVRYGILAGLLFASVVLTIRWCREFDSAWIIFLNHLVTCLFFAPVVFSNGVYPNGEQLIYLFGFGALQMGIPYVLFARAVRSVSSHEASGILLLEPILAPLWVWVAWRNAAEYEAPTVSTMIGAGLILTGLAIRYWPRKKAGYRSKESNTE